MWNKPFSPLLFVRLSAHGPKKKIRLWMYLFPLAICRLLFSLDGILGCIRGKPGQLTRSAVNSANGILLSIMSHEPLTLADIASDNPQHKILLQVHTLGFGVGKEKE